MSVFYRNELKHLPKVVSLNLADGEVYSIQYYVRKKIQCIATYRWFYPGTLVFYTNKTDFHDN